MNITHRRSRYQAGSLTTEHRNQGADVYVFRWREPIGGGKTKQFKVVLGTVKELTKTQARKKADNYRQQTNVSEPVIVESSMTVAELVEHYKERELGDNCGKTAKVVKAYKYVFTNYVVPKWGTLPLRAVKAVEVEDWLRSWIKLMVLKPRFVKYSGRPSGTPCVTSFTRQTL
jgi:integrase